MTTIVQELADLEAAMERTGKQGRTVYAAEMLRLIRILRRWTDEKGKTNAD